MSREDKQGVAIIVILMLLGISAFALTYKIKPKKYSIDQTSLCVKHEQVKLKKIILIDKSDTWSNSNIEKMNRWLADIHNNIEMKSQLNILSLSGDSQSKTSIKTVFNKCSPGNEEDCNALYENCRDIQRHYKEAFEKPLIEITEMLGRPGEAKNSPLFETMTQIVDEIESEEAEIHIISDFIENGYKFNFYKKIPTVKKIMAEYSLPSESKIKIYLHIIERRKHNRKFLDQVKKTWEEYFAKQGIKVESSKRFFISD